MRLGAPCEREALCAKLHGHLTRSQLALGIRLERVAAGALADFELPAGATLHDSGLISLTIANVDEKDVLEPVFELLTNLAELYKPKPLAAT